MGQDFELKAYGSAGRPLVAFPSMGGRFFDFENFGMIEACRPRLESGRLRVFAVDGRDGESWLNEGARIEERGRRHEAWDACIAREVMPFIRRVTGCGPRDPILAGCSGGAFHAANFFFRHPDLCGGFIGLSGVYSLEHFKPLGDYCDEHVYFNDPLRYLPGLNDAWYLERFRSARIVICAGQGAWEHVCLPESRRLSDILTAKGVPHWLDIWGRDVSHDWGWWRRQLAYFLEKILQ
ncbi:MAG: transposase [Elusimicrobia bacterium]|nr:transposase [Elusimicrobiota bacterium]